MKKSFRVSLSILAIAFIVGCSGGADPAEEVCRRYDDCNLLNPGVSVDECSELFQRVLDSLSSAERNDAELIMETCLQFQSCQAFSECMAPLIG